MGIGSIAPNSIDTSNDNCIIPGVDSSVFYKNYYNIFLFKSNDTSAVLLRMFMLRPILCPTALIRPCQAR